MLGAGDSPTCRTLRGEAPAQAHGHASVDRMNVSPRDGVDHRSEDIDLLVQRVGGTGSHVDEFVAHNSVVLSQILWAQGHSQVQVDAAMRKFPRAEREQPDLRRQEVAELETYVGAVVRDIQHILGDAVRVGRGKLPGSFLEFTGVAPS